MSTTKSVAETANPTAERPASADAAAGLGAEEFAAVGVDAVVERFRRPPDLDDELWRLLRQIPPGRVTTYAALAEALGDRRNAARWVGEAMLDHDHDDGCPCFRVVRSDGRLGHFIHCGGTARETQAELLRRDGIVIATTQRHRGNESADRVELGRYGCEPVPGSRPLADLRALQESLRGHVRLDGVGELPHCVAGVDVSYANPREGVVAYTLFDHEGREPVWATTLRRPVRFPYISTYLAYRELPLLLAVLDAARRAGRLAPVVLVDGSGILHPSGMGVATTLGVVASVPTVGVAKKLLCGSVDKETSVPPDGAAAAPGGIISRAVRQDGTVTATALWTSPRSGRPVYVSPGRGVSVRGAAEIVCHWGRGRRLPEPLWWADRLSRQAAR
ncbi:MAG: endonuclease V [Planctomycetales bacterium]|nr:endonuclease V [Planctomycetales bacterium]